ncbi:MAG: ABC transporter permease [Pseudomonadota bacterium]
MTDTTGPVLAADGTPLKRSLQRSLRVQKMRAFLLVAPLLLFILISFVFPIADMLFRSVENDIVQETLPLTTEEMASWDPESGVAPGERVFTALQSDIVVAAEKRIHTRLGSRLNYQASGISSLFRRSGRGADRTDADEITDQFIQLNEDWQDPATMATLAATPGAAIQLPLFVGSFEMWADLMVLEGDDPTAEQPWDFVYAALYRDILDAPAGDLSVLEPALITQVSAFEPFSAREAFEDIDDDWLDPEVWETLYLYSPAYTAGYFYNAVDLEKSLDGPVAVDEDQQIYITLFIRTLILSVSITFSCLMLGYPIAWLLSNIAARHANLLLILVLLPFWTSLLVRTSAWKVLLQQQGVINDVLVWIGLVDDANRLVMINNQLGTIIAMTHILLPFMILPLYSVMKTIPPSYLRAAKSLGATNWTAFWRVYFPQTIPGIGAGAILVFILAIGYYITPELVGGTSGIFISNRIAFHISSSLNWGLAAALGSLLLILVLALYWVYDRLVGVDKVSLG